MRERLITLSLGLAALLVFLTIFVRAGPPGADASVPTTVDRDGNGLLGAITWLQEEGVPTRAVRARLTALARMHDLPAHGNLLIVSLPAAVPFGNSEAIALDNWVREGNTLLVLAALSDRPAWALERGLPDADLSLLTGLEIASVSEPLARARRAERKGSGGKRVVVLERATPPLAKPQRDTLLPNRPQRYFEQVRAAVAFSDSRPQHRRLELPREAFPLCLAHIADSGDCGLWQLSDGAGSIVVSGFGSLFSNRALGEADNAQLLGNLVRGSLGVGGAVLFDDEHQGLSDSYDPARFYGDRRLYRTLAVLAAVWLVWVVGGTRLAAPASPPPAQGEAELVRATGSFLARVLRPAAAARRMYEYFFQRLARTLRAPTRDPAPYWDWLENHPRLAREDVARLRAWYAEAYSDGRVPLMRLHNLMVRTEMQLAA